MFWIKNGSNDDLTDTDFNNEFDLTGEHALTMGKDLFTIHSAGMSNSSARLMKISTKTKTLVSSAAYTADSSGSNTLRYVYAGGTNESTLASIDQPATPRAVWLHPTSAPLHTRSPRTSPLPISPIPRRPPSARRGCDLHV